LRLAGTPSAWAIGLSVMVVPTPRCCHRQRMM
jgi:hypothetical protein